MAVAQGQCLHRDLRRRQGSPRQHGVEAGVGRAQSRHLRGLQEDSGAEGYRCGPHRDAGSLAQSDDHRGLRRREGRVLRKAGLEPDRSGAEDARRGPQAQPRGADRIAAARRGRTSWKPRSWCRKARSASRITWSMAPPGGGGGGGQQPTPPQPEATAADAELGDVPGARRAEAVRAAASRLARVVRLRRRQHHRLGRPHRRRDELVPEDGREDAAGGAGGGAVRPHAGRTRAGPGHLRGHDAVRQPRRDALERGIASARTTSRGGATTSTAIAR